MNGFYIIIIIVWLSVCVAVKASFADKMQSIANEKGSKERFWAWCFWCSIFGALMVIALPDRGEQKQLYDKDDELPPL